MDWKRQRGENTSISVKLGQKVENGRTGQWWFNSKVFFFKFGSSLNESLTENSLYFWFTGVYVLFKGNLAFLLQYSCFYKTTAVAFSKIEGFWMKEFGEPLAVSLQQIYFSVFPRNIKFSSSIVNRISATILTFAAVRGVLLSECLSINQSLGFEWLV